MEFTCILSSSNFAMNQLLELDSREAKIHAITRLFRDMSEANAATVLDLFECGELIRPSANTIAIPQSKVATTADTYIDRWEHQTKTISTIELARQLDPNYKRENVTTIIGYPHSGRRITFTDGSSILSYGRGKSHVVRKE